MKPRRSAIELRTRARRGARVRARGIFGAAGRRVAQLGALSPPSGSIVAQWRTRVRGGHVAIVMLAVAAPGCRVRAQVRIGGRLSGPLAVAPAIALEIHALARRLRRPALARGAA